MNKGFHNPRLTVLIWIVVTLAAWLSVGWGVFEMQRLGHETGASGVAIGLGFPVAVIATGMLFLAIKGARTVAATLRGESVIARWTVSPTEFAEFAANNAARNALGGKYQNDWIPPEVVPNGGLEVIFNPDGVLVGDRYFGLVNTGMFKFEGVQILPENPLAIEFGTVATTISHASNVRIDRSTGVLRLPISRSARSEGVRVFEHYKGVDAREIVVNPGFYRGRIRFGLIAAPLCFALAGAGFAMEFGGLKFGAVPLVMAVGGVIFGLGGLLLALAAWVLSRGQYVRQ